MPKYMTGQDMGGFGRLARAELRKRRESRLDKESDQRAKLSDIQLQQAESNLSEINRKKRIRDDLGLLMQDIPEGENKFTAPYKYLMEQGAVDEAMKLMQATSIKIDSVRKADPYAADKMFNETIGRTGVGTTIKHVPGSKDLVEATQNGKKVFLRKTAKGFEKYDMPEGVTIDDLDEGIPVSRDKLNYWAKQYISTGKKVFPVRGKESNRLNKLVIDRAAEIQIEEGVTGSETAFLQEDRKSIQKSIAMQEKQRGSMVSFVENLGKQVDHVKDIADNIKTFDTRLFNKPARWVKKKFAGSPELSKYEVYLGEIQSEIGKLSSGSTASVSELSEGAREKWENILDENLSIKDMLEVLKEVKEAGFIRMRSVDEGLRKSRERLREIGGEGLAGKFGKKAKTQKYTEGQKAVGSNGEPLVFRGGVWGDDI